MMSYTTYEIKDFNPPMIHRAHDYDADLFLIDGTWEIDKIDDVEAMSVITMRRKIDDVKIQPSATKYTYTYGDGLRTWLTRDDGETWTEVI